MLMHVNAGSCGSVPPSYGFFSQGLTNPPSACGARLALTSLLFPLQFIAEEEKKRGELKDVVLGDFEMKATLGSDPTLSLQVFPSRYAPPVSGLPYHHSILGPLAFQWRTFHTFLWVLLLFSTAMPRLVASGPIRARNSGGSRPINQNFPPSRLMFVFVILYRDGELWAREACQTQEDRTRVCLENAFQGAGAPHKAAGPHSVRKGRVGGALLPIHRECVSGNVPANPHLCQC